MATTKKEEKPATQAENLPVASNSSPLEDMEVEVSIELGRSKMTLDSALSLTEQSLVELDRLVGDPVDVRINGKLYARGEVVTVSENFGVRLTQIIDANAA
jgi:flagellar motor switch protein FliN/FliY